VADIIDVKKPLENFLTFKNVIKTFIVSHNLLCTVLRLNSTTRVRPDPTRQSPRTLSETRVCGRVSRKSPCGSGRARVVEFSLYGTCVLCVIIVACCIVDLF